jgi:hypothetical protein
MRGQAFDTFKLLIAAVVAIAILGILLGILSGIILPGADPETIIGQQLTRAYQYEGSTFVSPANANFRSGVSYSSASFTDKIGGAYASIKFQCSTELKGSSPVCKEVGTNSDRVDIKGDFTAKISACCEPNKSPPVCHIMIGADTLNC